MSEEELERLTAADGQLGALVSQVREDLPQQERMAAVAVGLGALLDGPPGGTGASAPQGPVAAPSASGLTGSGWLLLAGGAAVGVIAAAVWLTSSEPAEEGAESPAAQPAGGVVEAPITPVPAPEPPKHTEAAVEAAPPEPSGLADGAGSNSAKPPKSLLASEARLLERARQSLSQNPKRSLALTRQHKRQFPSGVLRQEREVIAIAALKRLERDDAARKRAGEFGRNHEGSAHQKKVDSLVDGG